MVETVKEIRVKKTAVKFDPNIFECFVPKLSRDEESDLLKEISHLIAQQNLNASSIYITRIFRDDFAILEKEQNATEKSYPIKLLTTYSCSPVLDIQEIVLQGKSFNYQIEELPYEELGAIPNVFDNVKKLYYGENNKDQNNNESRRIEGIKNMVINAVFTCEHPPLPILPDKPQSPITLSDDAIDANMQILENRFQLEKNTIANILLQASLKRKKIDEDLVTVRDQLIEPIENNLRIIDDFVNNSQSELIGTQFAEEEFESELSEMTRQKLLTFMQSQIDIIKNEYSRKKILLLQALYDQSSETRKLCETFERTADKVKDLLKEYNYGYAIDQLTYVKHYLIWSLYHAALIYLNENWDLAKKNYANNTSKMIDFRKNILNYINEKFHDVISINKFCAISSLDEAYTKFEKYSLNELSKLAHDIFVTCDDKYGVNSNSLECSIKCLREMNESLQNELKFKPFIIPNTYFDKTGFYCEPTSKIFEENTNEQFEVAQKRLNTYSMIIKTDIPIKDLIPVNLQKDLENLNVNSLQAIKNIKIFKKIISEDEILTNILHQCDETISAFETYKMNIEQLIFIFDSSSNSLIEYEGEQSTPHSILTQLAGTNIQNIKNEFQNKINIFKNKTDELTMEINKYENDLKRKNQSFNSMIRNVSNQLVLTPTHLETAHEIIAEVKSLQTKIETDYISFTSLFNNLSNLENMFKIPLKSKKLIASASTQVENMNRDKNSKLNVNRICDINKFYLQIAVVLKNEKIYINDTSLAQLNKIFDDHINMTINQIEAIQKKHNTLLFCHIIVNDLLNFKKWKTILNGQKVFKNQEGTKIYNSIIALLRIVLEDKQFQNWNTHPEIAENLLHALKIQATINNAPILQELQQFPVHHEELCNRLMSIASKNENDFLLLKQDDLNLIKLPGNGSEEIDANTNSSSENKNNEKQTFTHLKPIKPIILDVMKFNHSPRINKNQTDHTHQTRKNGFLNRHWDKILLGSLVAGLVIGGIFTCGILAATGIIAGGALLSTIAMMTTSIGAGIATCFSAAGVTIGTTTAATIGAGIITATTMGLAGTTVGLIAKHLDNKKLNNPYSRLNKNEAKQRYGFEFDSDHSDEDTPGLDNDIPSPYSAREFDTTPTVIKTLRKEPIHSDHQEKVSVEDLQQLLQDINQLGKAETTPAYEPNISEAATPSRYGP